MAELVPSKAHPNGFAALRQILQDAQSVSAAIAFVTETGVEQLAKLLGEAGSTDMEIVARAGGVTSPEALLSLRDELVSKSR